MFGTSESLVGRRRRRRSRMRRREAWLFHTWWCWKSLISPWLISFASFTLRVWDDVQFSHAETVRNHQETFLQRGSVCLEFKTPPGLAHIDFSSMHWERYWLGEKDRGTGCWYIYWHLKSTIIPSCKRCYSSSNKRRWPANTTPIPKKSLDARS